MKKDWQMHMDGIYIRIRFALAIFAKSRDRFRLLDIMAKIFYSNLVMGFF